MIDFEQENNDILKGYSMLLYFSGSFILNEPMESCIKDFANGDLFRKMPISSNNPNYILASSFLNNISSKSPVSYDEILADYLTLFGLSGIPQAPPFESYYCKEPASSKEMIPEVHYTYQAYGWQPETAESVPHDHLGIELQFLNLMLEKYHEIEDGVCHMELSKDIKKFIDNHLRPWLSEWNAKMQEHAISDFYKGIAFLVVACVQDVYFQV